MILVDPLGDRAPCFLKTAEIVLPNAFFLQAPKSGMITRDAFRDALKHGVQLGEIASTVPMNFEDYWHFANNM